MNFYIFTSCTTNTLIKQTATLPSNVTIGSILKNNSGECYRYIGQFVNYIPPSGYLITNINMFTATTQTTYGNCIDCLIPPVVMQSYLKWEGRAGFSLSCPICQLTDFGGKYTWYTSSADTKIQTDVYVYENTELTIPLYVDFIRYSNKIYKVDVQGKITEYCNVNGNCT